MEKITHSGSQLTNAESYNQPVQKSQIKINKEVMQEDNLGPTFSH